MAGVGLAADLARKAAGGVAGAAEASGAGKGRTYGGAGWIVPTFPESFQLDSAMQVALTTARDAMNWHLQHEGVVVRMQQAEAQTQAHVLEMGSERVLRAYDGVDFLRLYAGQDQRRGVVVDGGL